MAPFSALSLNVNHTSNFSEVIEHLKSKKPAVFFLQECPLETEQLNIIVSRFGYKAFSSLVDYEQPGVAVLYLEALGPVEILPLEPGRLLFIKISDNLSFINVYGPSGNNQKFARKVLFNETLPRNLQLRNLQPILIGDFNCITSEKDCEQYFSQKKSTDLALLVNTFNYTDIFRFLKPQTREYSFSRPGCTASRIDRIYLPARALPAVESMAYFPSLSDHKGMELVFKEELAPLPPKIPGLWRLNTNVLSSPDFLPNFINVWQECLLSETDFQEPHIWWEESCKPRIRAFLIRFALMRNKSMKTTKNFLFSALDKFINEKNFEKAKEIRERLRVIITMESMGYTLHSRDMVEEERVSLFHLSKAFKNGAANSLSKLNIGGVEVDNPTEIQEEVCEFFGHLFNGYHRSDPSGGEPIDTGVPFEPDFDDFNEFSEGLGSLDDAEAEGLEVPVILEELFSALDSCPDGRSPGMDGLPYEFYKKTRHIIGEKLVLIFNSQLNDTNLISSFSTGVTKLLPKVKGVPTVKQVRPLTLQNSDYKLLSKVLTVRLNSVLNSCLKSRQLANNEDEIILNGVTDILSSIEYCKVKNINAYLVSYDIFKAFDKTNISFVLKVMKKMNFKENFLSWIQLFHTGITTNFFINGVSKIIDLINNIRQGDPLAMPLFLINIEPLLLKLNSVIKGLKVGVVDQKEEGYVDDITAVSTDPNDLLKIDKLFTDFEALSGTVLNRSNKCKVMGLGGWKGRQNWPLAWLQPVDSVKIYGIHFCPSISESLHLSWKICLEKFNNCLQAWSGRALPFLSQKATVLKVFATSKLWYLGQVFPIPKAVVTEIERRMGGFLWQGRLERLEINELVNSTVDGGLGLPNIQAKCDALFIKHLTRILSKDCRSRDHLLYWVGLRLRNLFPAFVPPLRSIEIPPYFLHCVRMLEDKVLDLDVQRLESVTTKEVYGLFNCTPPPPKVMDKRSLNWERVWLRLNDPVLCRESLDICFSILHDIYPTRERLKRCRQHLTGFCHHCPRTTETAVHLFAECSSILHLWIYVKNLMIRNDIITSILVDDKLCLFFDLDVEKCKIKLYLFLISKYILFVHLNKKQIQIPNVRQLKSFLVHKLPNNLGLLI